MSELNPPAKHSNQYSARDLSPNSLRIKSRSPRSRSPNDQPVPSAKPLVGTAHHASAASAGPYLNTQSFENVSRMVPLFILYELILILTIFTFFCADFENGSADLDVDFASNFPTEFYGARFCSFPEDPKELSIF